MQTPLQAPRTLQDYWIIARRRCWWLVLPLFLGWGSVFAASWLVTPRYRSETVIIVESQKVAEQYVGPNIAADVQERLQTMMQQILSRTRLQAVLNRFHPYGPGTGQKDTEGLVQQMRRDINIELVAGRPGDLSAFKISYSASSPLLAQQVTNELSSLFIAENMRGRQQVSESTTEFLAGQLQDVRNNLEREEQRLSDFKARHLGELPEQLGVNAQVLSGLQSRLQAEMEALDEANQQHLYLEAMQQGQWSSTPGGEGVPDSVPTLVTVDERIRKLKAQLEEMTVRYTPDHPDVRRLREDITTAEKLRQQMLAGSKAGSAATGPGLASADGLSNVSPQLRNQLAANRLRIVHHESEVRRLEKEIQDYQSRLNGTPLVEQQLAEIMRDYGQAKSTYETLVGRETQSEMATNLEKSQRGELFKVIDPPNLPLKPYKPDRFKFSLLGLLLGLVLAGGVTALIEMIDVRIYREQDLREIVAVPILATIPLLKTEVEQQTMHFHQRLQAIAVSMIVLAIPTITVFTYYRG